MGDILRGRFADISAGDHIVFIYDDTSELMAFAVPFIKDGLAKRERCLCVIGDLSPAEVTEALAAGGVDVARESQRGALEVLRGEEFAGPPPVDPLRLADAVRKRAQEAESNGFAGQRIAGEMTWVLTASLPGRALVEYELLLEGAADSLTIACMYRKDRFDPAVLQQMIRTHAKVVAGDYVYLSLSALFQNLARADLQGLAKSARERRVPKAEFFFHQGDPAAEVFMLMNGMVKLVRTDPDGRSVILRIANPIEPFGARAALGATSRFASAEALEDSRALVWDSATILQAIMTHPAVSLNAIRLLEERVDEERGRLLDLATVGVEQRLARLLLRLERTVGRKSPAGVVLGVSLSGQDLAELVITTPYTISRILAEWRRLRIADVRREQILLQDPERIAAIAALRTGRELPEVGKSGPAARE